MKAIRSLGILLLLAACAEEQTDAPIYDTAVVETRSIGVMVGSAGVVEPLATVEVKSKASGEVLELLVETGDYVTEGDLMVRIDPRTVSNRLAQAEAELKAAESRRTISQSQMVRAERLVEQGTFTEADYEQAALELANAEAQVVSADVAVENARIAVDDTDIRAPVSGAIIEKPVEKGQVISSPTQDFGGGTLLLKMADLSAVQVPRADRRDGYRQGARWDAGARDRSRLSESAVRWRGGESGAAGGRRTERHDVRRHRLDPES